MLDEAAAPGAARAGSAFASRRKQIGLSQREVARRRVITAANLIEFEKGRSWPRERTRARLEELVGWPAGTIAAIATDGSVSEDAAVVRQVPARSPSAGKADLAAQIGPVIDMALSRVDAALAELPADADPRFAERAAAVLADLRQLETVAVRAVRGGGAASPAAARMLATVRRRFDELTARAAAAPDAPVGRRLAAARKRCRLSVDEVAAVLGAPRELVIALENGHGTPELPASRVEALLAELGDR